MLDEGDKQLYQLNSQTGMKYSHTWGTKFFSVCLKHNSLQLWPIQPSSPTIKELHGWDSNSQRGNAALPVSTDILPSSVIPGITYNLTG